jgi:hydroxysqualene synthase
MINQTTRGKKHRRRVWTIAPMKTGVAHEENFPVASWLCPPRLRPVIAAIYWFARTADDIADEGDAHAGQRLADLAAYRQALNQAARQPAAPHSRWPDVFVPLAAHIHTHQLPLELLHDLLSAFEQDVHRTANGQHYTDHGALLGYCSLSANPVGRLLLHLYGITDPALLAQSDHICTALQLINFWQDLSRDLPRQRHYLPLAELQAAGLTHADFAPGANPSAKTQQTMEKLIAELLYQASASMQKGAKLCLQVPGRAGWELRLVVQGGLRIAEKAQALHHRTWLHRPKLGVGDVPLLLWRAWRMG